MKSGITVIVAERYPIIRWAIKNYYSNHTRIVLTELLTCASEALAVAKRRMPDVVVIDTSSLDDDDIDTVLTMVAGKQFGVVDYCTSDSWNICEKFMGIGSYCFVPKTAPLEELTQAIEAAASGKTWIAPSFRNSERPVLMNENLDELSNRELQIVNLITEGQTTRQIADRLCLSVNTVESHRKRIFKKLDVRNAAQLTKRVLTR